MAAAKPVVTGDIDFELLKTMMKQVDSDIDDIIKENEEIEELKLIAFKYAAAYARDPKSADENEGSGISAKAAFNAFVTKQGALSGAEAEAKVEEKDDKLEG